MVIDHGEGAAGHGKSLEDRIFGRLVERQEVEAGRLGKPPGRPENPHGLANLVGAERRQGIGGGMGKEAGQSDENEPAEHSVPFAHHRSASGHLSEKPW